MNKKIGIEGLDCANCAKTLENEINKLEGISGAKVDFVKSSITFESNDVEKAIKDIISLTKKIEPDAHIIENQKILPSKKKSLIINLSTLFSGIAVGLCAILIPLPVWAFWTLFVISALLLGYKTYYKALTLLLRGTINENLLITISVAGAAALGESMEALMVVGLYTIGKILEGLAVDKSRKSIEKLTNLQPEFARIITNGKEEKILPSDVILGAVILIKPGEKVPVDGKILEGQAMVDMRSLTGENVPVSKHSGEEILSGCIVIDGVLKIEATSKYSECTVSRIMNMIENASEKKSKTETFISKFTRWYTLIVVGCAIITWGIVWGVTGDIMTAVYRGLTFLVVSCPCAFAISVPLAYFSGIGNASRQGILIKGSNYLDACAKLNILGFDKTGTLTNGEFVINEITSFDKNLSESDILYLSAIGEQYSNHPLAKGIISANTIPLKEAQEIKEESGKGVSFSFEGKKYFVGRKNKDERSTVVELCCGRKILGKILLVDGLKENSPKACAELKNLGVKTVLLSGDNAESVDKVAELSGVAKAYSRLLPQDKYAWVEEQKKDKKNKVGFVGDGINDAPALMLADVGIAMGITGTDATIEASDIVIVNDDPLKVATAVKLSRYIRRIVWENIILALTIKVTALILTSLGITGMLVAVFADVGVTLLAILNSIRALKHKVKDTKK